MKPSSRASGRKQVTLELSPAACARLDELAKLLDCSKVSVIQRSLVIMALAISQRLLTPDGKVIVPL